MNEIDRLREGNKRYVEGKLAEKDVGLREKLRAGQKPFVTLITCSDSRVVPEYIFDAQLGELFVIRVAGNVIDDVALASIEYGVEHLQTPLLLVLGHESCGAVTAAYEIYKNNKEVEGVMKELMERIKPSVLTAIKNNEGVEEAVLYNMKNVTDDILSKSPVVRELKEKGKLKIVEAKYFFDGHVEFYE